MHPRLAPQLSRCLSHAFWVKTSDLTTSSSALPDSTGRPSNLLRYAKATARSSAAKSGSEQMTRSAGLSGPLQEKLGTAALAGEPPSAAAAVLAQNATIRLSGARPCA